MGEPEPKKDEPKKERRFSEQQYEMLLRCSAKKDTAEWNEWRRQNRRQEVLLEGAKLDGTDLKDANLKGACLEGADLRDAHLEGANLSMARLEGAYLRRAHLQRAYLYHAHLENAYLYDGHLEGADLSNSHLDGAVLAQGHLEDANLSGANMVGVDFKRAHLDHVNLCYAHLEDANLKYAHLERAFLVEAHVENAHFVQAIVDGSTLFWGCYVGRNTDFRGVGLDSVRIDPATKQLLEYNIRRMNWEDWYQQHPRLQLLVKRFWQISDYGASTKQIINIFFKLVLVFAAVYYVWGCIDFYVIGTTDYPGIVSNLFVDRQGLTVEWWLVPLRTVYFSVVTMTTLGFGDMYANAHSVAGHILLSLQVILGYVLLGALVTRFAVLFTAGGPAGKFAEPEGRKDVEKEKSEGPRIK